MRDGKRYDKRFRGGLEVRVFPSGAKVFQYVYESPVTSSRRRMTLGTYSGKGKGGLSVAEARRRADGARLKVSSGIDPQIAEEDRQKKIRLEYEKEQRALSVNDLIDLFEQNPSSDIKVDTHKEYISRLRRHVAPTLGEMNASDVTAVDVRRLITRLFESGKKVESNKILTRIKLLFSWAVGRARLESNPAKEVEPLFKEKPRKRILSPEEMNSLWSRLPQLPGDDKAEVRGDQAEEVIQESSLMSPVMGVFFRLLLLTGQRSGDIRKARWSNINFESGEWLFLPEDTKNGQGQRFRMTPMMRKELMWLYRNRVSDRLFPHRYAERKEEPMVNTSPDKAISRWRLEGDWPFVDAWVPHDLRRTCRTQLSKLKIPMWIAERVLNHKPNKMIRVYDLHDYYDEISDALAAWNVRLEEIVQSVESVK